MVKKQKYQLEYIIHSSQSILYNMLCTPSGLSEWFADNVIIDGNIYTFVWDNAEEQARLVKQKKLEFIQFQWLDDEGTDYYFEFKIAVDHITNDVALLITDFVEKEDMEGTKLLWDTQVQQLMQTVGM